MNIKQTAINCRDYLRQIRRVSDLSKVFENVEMIDIGDGFGLVESNLDELDPNTVIKGIRLDMYSDENGVIDYPTYYANDDDLTFDLYDDDCNIIDTDISIDDLDNKED